MRLLFDVHRPATTEVAVVRSIARSNPRLALPDALYLATCATVAARAAAIDPNWFAATMLQESAFDPQVVSWAGAIGIAQFTIETADAYGVDPTDPPGALRGAARLLAGYVRAYAGSPNGSPYSLALAAYNAGPVAVERYHGVPPYPETRGYIDDITDRWGTIARDER